MRLFKSDIKAIGISRDRKKHSRLDTWWVVITLSVLLVGFSIFIPYTSAPDYYVSTQGDIITVDGGVAAINGVEMAKIEPVGENTSRLGIISFVLVLTGFGGMIAYCVWFTRRDRKAGREYLDEWRAEGYGVTDDEH